MKLLSLPIPVMIAVVQIADRPEIDGPAWFGGAIAALFLVAYVLNITGKFPGATGERRSATLTEEDLDRIASRVGHKFAVEVLQKIGQFVERDRSMLTEVHRTVTREDMDKPGWPMVWNSAKEAREARADMARLADLVEMWLKHDRARLELRVQHLEDAMRNREHAQHRDGNSHGHDHRIEGA